MTRLADSISHRIRQTGIACLPFVFWSGGSLQAAETSGAAPMISTPAAILQVGVGLLFVIGLMFLLAWLARRMRLVPGGHYAGSLKILAVLPLGNREKLALVQVGGQQLLLGITPQQIQCLYQLEQPLDLPVKPNSPAFAGLLQQWKNKTRQTESDHDT